MIKKILTLGLLVCLLGFIQTAVAQDTLPLDNTITDYHNSPNYRESESHPLRVIAYIVHPVGWAARELIFRPLSYFASSTELTRSVMGYRGPHDYRTPECFSAENTTPNCREIQPYINSRGTGFGGSGDSTGSFVGSAERQAFFPDVNFDFDKRKLNDLGLGRVHQIADLLKKEDGVKIVLQGHADYMGSDAYNEKLGMDRAEAVRQSLVALGVPADRMSTVTFGEAQPLYKDQEDWARAVNRRVQVHGG